MASSVLAGVTQDVEVILFKYVNQKNCSFASFSAVWKELQFHYIYSGRPTVLEMKYFTRELLLLVKCRALSNYTMWEKSGAIFLLYALYFTQPLSQKVTIRVEQSEWNELWKFADEMKTVNMEVSYCFYRLVVYNAFDFTFSNKPFSIESMKEDDFPRKQSTIKPQRKYKYDKFAMGSLLTSIGFDPTASAQRESKYNDIKQALNEKFPDLCNFEIRRFAVNLLVPTVDQTEEQAVPQESSTSIKKKKKSKKKNEFLGLPLMTNDEDVLEDNNLSMPLIHSNDSEIDEEEEAEEYGLETL